MSYCQNCGQQMDDTVQYCPNCGAQNANFYNQQPAYAQPAYAEPAYAEPAQPQYPYGVNAMAIVGMAISGLGIPGIIVSSIAKKRAASGQYSSPLAPLATAGLVVSIICTVLWFIYLIIFIVALANS